VDLGQVVRERAVVLFSIEAAAHGRAAVTMASLVARDVLALGSELGRIGVPGDGLVWFDRCGALAPALLSELATRGEAAGLPALLTSTAPGRAEALADEVNVLVLHRLTDPAAAERFAVCTGQKFAPAAEGDFAAAAGSQVRRRATAGVGAASPATAGPADPGGPAGQLSQLGPYGLVRKPVVAARSLSRLGNGEHVLIVRRPRRRLVTLALTVPARVLRHPARPLSARQAASAGLDPATAVAAVRDTGAGPGRKGRAT
jgi:hypothetical protein